MKKRILSLLLAVITILQLVPAFTLPIIAEGENDDAASVIGSLVKINTDDQVYLYSDVTYSGPSSKTERVYRTQLPETLKIVDVIITSYDAIFYKLGTVDGSSHSILDNYSWIKAPLVNIISTPQPEPDDGLVRGEVGLELDGEVISSLEIEKGEKTYVFTDLGDKITGTPMYNWQLLIDKEDDRWANIMDSCYPYIAVTEALILNARDESGKATLRCIVTSDGTKYVSGELTVSLEQPVASLLSVDVAKTESPKPRFTYLSSPFSFGNDITKLGEEYTEFQIEVNYVYLHATAADSVLEGKTPGETVTITIGTGSAYTGNITSPPQLGYKPYVDQATADILKMTYNPKDLVEYPKGSGNKYVYAPEIKFENQSNTIAVMVYYIPQQVNYLVRIYEQNLRDDNYTLADTFIVSNENTVSDSVIGEGLDAERVGFQPLYYDPDTVISGDGATVIDIYYDREYYLVDFDLKETGGTGYGVVPMYVRYDTQVMIGTPTNPGYTFEGWELSKVYTVDPNTKKENVITDSKITELYDVKVGGSMVTVHHNLDYKALWEVATASYTIIYWRENANDNGFSIWTTETATGDAGSTVNVSNKRVPTSGVEERSYFTYNEALSDKEVVIKGDGTAAANIYYTRNIYYIVFQASDNEQLGTNRGCHIALHTHGTNCCSIEGCDHTDPSKCKLELYCKLGHKHTAACAPEGFTCGMVDHEHSADCCSIVPHAHETGNCTCKIKEHTSHTAECCTITEHTHNNGCYNHKLSCYSTKIDSKDALNGGNNYTSEISEPQDGYVYRYGISSGWFNTTYYNYFYLDGQWYYLGNSNRQNAILDSYGVSISSNLTDPRSGTYTSMEANLTNTCKCTPNDDEHTHGDGACSCKDTLHTHGQGDCSCKLTEHIHGSGCVYCSLPEHEHGDDCADYTCNPTGHEHTAGCYQECIRYEHKTHDGCSRNLYVISAKYNADIADDWPVEDPTFIAWRAAGWLGNNVYYSEWKRSTDRWATKRVDMTAELCNTTNGNKTYTLTLTSVNKQGANTVTYMFESIDQTPGSGKVLHTDGLYYEASERYTQKGMVASSFGAKEILGMQKPTNESATLYYKRNPYTLKFVNGGVTEKSVSIKYEAPLTSQYYKPDIPSSYEENSVVFAGWYTTQLCADGTEFDFSKDTMPAGDLYLYAKWAPTSWSVKVYNDKEIMETDPSNTLMDETVDFGSMIDEPTYTKINENYIFAGWYYVENGEEQRFDFKTMQVKKDYVIYAKWVSKVPVPYTIYYKTMKDGVLVDIAKPTTGQSLAGVSKSFTAAVNEDLYEAYRVGYYPTARSVSLMMSAEHENEYTFIYQTLESTSYTVHHTFTDDKILEILKTTNEFSFFQVHLVTEPSNTSPLISVSFRDMAQEQIVKDAIKAQYPSLKDADVNNLWSAITELSPNSYLQELILVADPEQNIVEFEWTNRHSSAIYEIVYKIKNLDDDGYSTYMILHNEAVIGHSVSITEEEAKDIPGFKLNLTKSQPTMSATLLKPLAAGGGTTLTLYYDRILYTYTVDYYKRGTMEKLRDTVTHQVLFETVVTENAVNISGYHVVGQSSITEEITVQNQSIAFYYEADDIDYVYGVVTGGKGILSSYGEKVNIIKEPKGSIPTPNKGYVFAGWYTDKEGTIPVTDDVAMVTTTAGSDYGKITPVNPDLAPDEAIYFYAKFVPHKLTIQNSFLATVNPSPALDMFEQGFIYTVSGVSGTATAGITVRLVVIGNGSQTIFGLPAGDYTVTVENEWSWRYDQISRVEIRDDGDIWREDLSCTDMQWTISFDGSDTVVVHYDIPGMDISGTTESNSYFFVTDNANSV